MWNDIKVRQQISFPFFFENFALCVWAGSIAIVPNKMPKEILEAELHQNKLVQPHHMQFYLFDFLSL